MHAKNVLKFSIFLSILIISCAPPIGGTDGGLLNPPATSNPPVIDPPSPEDIPSADNPPNLTPLAPGTSPDINLSDPVFDSVLGVNSEVWLMQVNRSDNHSKTAAFSKLNNFASRNAISKNLIEELETANIKDSVPEFVRKERETPFRIIEDESLSRSARAVNPQDGDEKPFVENGKTYKYFWVHQEYMEGDVKKDSVKKYKAEQIKVGQYSTIWYIPNSELGISGSSNETKLRSELNKLSTVFDEIYPLETKLLGTEELKSSVLNKSFGTMNSEKNVEILVYDISEDDKDGSVCGYFYSGDMFTMRDLAPEYNIACNHALMFHLDSCFLENRPDTIYSTLVHEFNHLLNYVNKTYNHPEIIDRVITMKANSSWFTEMLSAMAEDVMYEVCLKKYSAVNDVQKTRVPEFVDYYNLGFKEWKLYECYGNVYGYGAYLLRNFMSEDGSKKGISLLHEIATNEYFNEEAITQALITVTGKASASYESTIPLYPMAVFCNNTKYITLNRNVIETVGGTTYKLTAINVADYKNRFRMQTFGRTDMGFDNDFRPMGIRLDKVDANLVQNRGIIHYTYDESKIDDLYVTLCVKNGTEISYMPLNWE